MDVLVLSTELLLCVAASLSRIDLLNLSLTCKRWHGVAVSELSREYVCPRGKDSITKFVKRLLSRPDLSRAVRIVRLNRWRTLKILDPDAISPPSESDYTLFANAAREAGLIATITPYETETAIMSLLPRRRFRDGDGDFSRYSDFHGSWQKHVFGDYDSIDSVSYDSRFCQLLRAGTDEPLIHLLLSLLPNLRQLYLRGTPGDPYALPWPRCHHQFASLRQIVAHGLTSMERWPLSFIQNGLQPQVESLKLFGATSWTNDIDSDNGPWIRELRHIPSPLSSIQGPVNISNVELQSCVLTYTDMETFLGACFGIKSFRFELGPSFFGQDNFTPTELVELLLRNNRSTLRKLYIDIYHNWLFTKPRGLMDSLADFTSLRKLLINPRDMKWMMEDQGMEHFASDQLLSNRLPSSLENLTVRETPDRSVDYDDEMLLYKLDKRQILGLMDVQSEKFPALKSATMILVNPERYFDDRVPAGCPLPFTFKNICDVERDVHDVYRKEPKEVLHWNSERYLKEQRKTSQDISQAMVTKSYVEPRVIVTGLPIS